MKRNASTRRDLQSAHTSKTGSPIFVPAPIEISRGISHRLLLDGAFLHPSGGVEPEVSALTSPGGLAAIGGAAAGQSAAGALPLSDLRRPLGGAAHEIAHDGAAGALQSAILLALLYGRHGGRGWNVRNALKGKSSIVARQEFASIKLFG